MDKKKILRTKVALKNIPLIGDELSKEVLEQKVSMSQIFLQVQLPLLLIEN